MLTYNGSILLKSKAGKEMQNLNPELYEEIKKSIDKVLSVPLSENEIPLRLSQSICDHYHLSPSEQS